VTPAQRRRMWAIIGSHWDKDIGEYILYAFLIVRFGKSSTKALTPSETETMFDWLEEITGEEKSG